MISDMIAKAINYSRQQELKHQMIYKVDARVKQNFLLLDVDLAKLVDLIGIGGSSKSHQVKTTDLLNRYNNVLKDFLVMANLNNVNKLINISDDELAKIAKTKRDQDLEKVYLIIKKMLFNSYFQRNQRDFLYAFKAFVKLGVVDLGLSWRQVQSNFDEQFIVK